MYHYLISLQLNCKLRADSSRQITIELRRREICDKLAYRRPPLLTAAASRELVLSWEEVGAAGGQDKVYTIREGKNVELSSLGESTLVCAGDLH